MREYWEEHGTGITAGVVGIVAFCYLFADGGIDLGFSIIGFIVTFACVGTFIMDYWKKLFKKDGKHDRD